MTEIALIVAMAHGRVIGRDNALPWRLRDDLRRFKALTIGHTIVMGRKTWQSIGRPLPGRDNVVLTRDRAFRAQGCRVVHDLDDALRSDDERLFVIGGGHLYEATLPRASRLYVTQVHCHIEGDTFFPEVDWAEWSLIRHEPHPADAHNDYATTFMEFERGGRARVQCLR